MYSSTPLVNWQEKARKTADHIRYRVLEHTLRNNGGYMSQACSTAELFATLYLRILKLGPSAAPMLPPPFSGTPGKIIRTTQQGDCTTAFRAQNWIDLFSRHPTMRWCFTPP